MLCFQSSSSLVGSESMRIVAQRLPVQSGVLITPSLPSRQMSVAATHAAMRKGRRSSAFQTVISRMSSSYPESSRGDGAGPHLWFYVERVCLDKDCAVNRLNCPSRPCLAALHLGAARPHHEELVCLCWYLVADVQICRHSDPIWERVEGLAGESTEDRSVTTSA